MGPPSRSKDLPLQNCSAMPSPRATLLSIAALLANARYIICPASAFLQPIASRHGGDRTVLVPTMIPAGRTAGSCKNRQNAGVTIMSATTALDKRTSTDTYEVNNQGAGIPHCTWRAHGPVGTNKESTVPCRWTKPNRYGLCFGIAGNTRSTGSQYNEVMSGSLKL